VSLLPRFHASTTSGGPVVIDRDRALRAEFVYPGTSQAVASLLNADPARVEEFYWTNNEGEPRG
jgi:hypothetical protein